MQPTTAGRVLLISADHGLRESLTAALQAAGYLTLWVSDAASATVGILARTAQAVVVDVGSTGTPATTRRFLRHLLQATPGPCVAITARGASDQRIEALRAGAHDALSLPIDPAELVARLHALLASPGTDATAVSSPALILSPTLVVDLENSLVAHKDGLIALTAQEVRLLTCLAGRANRTVSHDDMCFQLGVSTDNPGLSVLRQTVARLRRKIDRPADRFTHLVTERGRGYCLIVQDSSTDGRPDRHAVMGADRVHPPPDVVSTPGHVP